MPKAKGKKEKVAKKTPKKKLTKAEKEKLKKEELERKAHEEEEERVREAEEEKRKKKEEKLLEAERQKLENEERKHRRLDMTALMEMITGNQNLLLAQDNERRQKAKWARYMRCDGSPDPSVAGEINTYINLRLQDKTRDNADCVLKDSLLDLALIEELEFLLQDTPLEDLPSAKRLGYRETIGELQRLIQLKLDAATLQVLCDSSKLQDPETNNLQYVLKNNSIALCLWGNLSKNPRIKCFEFAEVGFSFDIPRILILSNCAVRYLHTKFDHFSPYSKSYHSRCKQKEEVVVQAQSVAEDENQVKKDLEGVEEGAEVEEGEKKDEGEEKEAEEEKNTMDILASLRGEGMQMEEKAGEGIKAEEEENEEEICEEDYSDPVTPDLPEWEDFDEEDDIVDLRAYHVVGGIFTFDLLAMPPQPKPCHDWVITQLVAPPELEFLEYMADPQSPSGQEKNKEKEQEKDKRDEKPPINVTLRLPNEVMFLEEPLIAHWDNNKCYWTTDGFSNLVFDEENRMIKFSLNQFGTMCFLQDFHINMPFQCWELRPHQTNAAVLTITAAIVELEIEIKDGLCCLSQPSNKCELAHMCNHWVSPKQLVQDMRMAGLNIFPQEDSCKYVSVQNKNPIVLDRMYEQMGLVASAMAFSWSRWNSVVESSSLVVQGAEALKDEPLLEENWAVFMMTKRRFVHLKMSEFDEGFSEEMAEGIEIDFDVVNADLNSAFNHQGNITTRLQQLSLKSNLYHYIIAKFSDEAKERVQESSIEFVHCVQQLLKAIQVLTYA